MVPRVRLSGTLLCRHGFDSRCFSSSFAFLPRLHDPCLVSGRFFFTSACIPIFLYTYGLSVSVLISIYDFRKVVLGVDESRYMLLLKDTFPVIAFSPLLPLASRTAMQDVVHEHVALCTKIV